MEYQGERDQYVDLGMVIGKCLLKLAQANSSLGKLGC